MAGMVKYSDMLALIDELKKQGDVESIKMVGKFLDEISEFHLKASTAGMKMAMAKLYKELGESDPMEDAKQLVVKEFERIKGLSEEINALLEKNGVPCRFDFREEDTSELEVFMRQVKLLVTEMMEAFINRKR